MNVRDLMSTDVVTVGVDDRLVTAEELMGLRGFRHMPVITKNRQLVGFVSQIDIVRATLKGDEGDHRAQLTRKASIKVEDIMSKRMDTLTPHDDLASAARKMRKKRRAALPVVDEGGTLVGILTEADFAVALADILESADSALTETLRGLLKGA